MISGVLPHRELMFAPCGPEPHLENDLFGLSLREW